MNHRNRFFYKSKRTIRKKVFIRHEYMPVAKCIDRSCMKNDHLLKNTGENSAIFLYFKHQML